MIYNISIVSIPSTGTIFLKELINPDGFKHAHSYKTLEMLQETRHIVAPLRHPALVWATHAKKQSAPFEFWNAFEMMDKWAKLFRIHFIPIDLPRLRVLRLREFEKQTGKLYQTSWKPKNETPPNDRVVPDVDLGPLWEYPFVKNHYPEPKRYRKRMEFTSLEHAYFDQA